MVAQNLTLKSTALKFLIMKAPKRLVVALLCLLIIELPSNSFALTVTNALTNQSAVSSIFDDFTYSVSSPALGGRDQSPSDGGFAATGGGLTLTNSTNFFGVYALKQPLGASNSWVATVKAHVGLFTNNQVNPWFYAGLSVFKAGTNLETTAMHQVNAIFVRRSQGSLTNQFVPALKVSTNSTEATPVEEEYYLERQSLDGQPLTHVWLRLSYDSAVKTIRVQRSFDGTNFGTGTSWDLASAWGLTETNQFILALIAGNEPFNGEPATYKVKTGEIYLRDFTLTSGPQPGSRIVYLQSTTNLATGWTNVPLIAEKLDGSGNVDAGPSTSSNSFYRMRIQVQQ
jgi:hypothetical protein